MEAVPNPTPPRRSNRIRRAKEDKEISSDDNSGAPVGTSGSPPWSVQELKIFLAGLEEHGTAWKKIASTLRNRTPQMVEELYESNSNYLSLPAEVRQATVLYSILKDRMRDQILADMEGEEEVAAVVLAEGQKENEKAKASSLSPKRKVKGGTSATVVMTPERNKRVKSTRQLFPPSPVSSRRKATSTPKQTPTKKQKTQHQSRSATPPKSSRVLRTRKSSAEVGANGGTPPPSNSDGLPLKLREKFLKGKMGESPAAPPKKKKGTAPSTPSSKRKKDLLLESRIEGMQSQLQSFLNNKKALNWCMYEWFYPDIDRPFFDVNDFQNCLDSTGVGNVTHLTRVEWGFIRTVFGKARRFSPAFLKEEREKLADYRESIRQLRHGKSPVSRSVYQFPYIPPSLPQSTRVLAFHPETRQLQLGIVIAEEHSRYKIEFDNKELGEPQWIPDTDVMAHEAKEWPPARTPTNASPRTPVRQRIPNSPLAGLTRAQQIEVHQLYELVKLLQQKEDLIQRLRKMNDEAEKMAIRSDFPSEFQRHYALAIKKLAQVNEYLTPRLQNLRNHTPQPSPGGNAKDGNHASPWPPSLFATPTTATNSSGSTTPAPPAVISPPGTTSASNSPPTPTTSAASSSSSSSFSSLPPSITFSSPTSASSAASPTPATIITTITTTTTTAPKTSIATATPEQDEEAVVPMEIGADKPVSSSSSSSPTNCSLSSSIDDVGSEDTRMPDSEESGNTPP